MQDELARAGRTEVQPAAAASDTLAARLRSLDEIRTRLSLGFPFILKPDFGQRGVGIKLIRSAKQAEAYLRQTSAPLVAQRYAPGPQEAGIFYYRFPHEPRGHIFAITEKLFPVLVGDGKSTVPELVWRDSRARFMADKYLQRFGKRQNEVLAAGEELKLVEAGNHAQGCIFREGMRLSTPALTESVDTISQRLTVFFIGRYDIRYANEEDLRAGKKLSNHRTERRGLRSNEYLRRVQLDLCRLSDAFPAVEFGLRHRRGESEARLRANEAFARLAKVAGVFSSSRDLPGGGLSQAMCTVTFIARRRSYCLGMNRDEKLTRPTGLPPKKKNVNGRGVMCPSEPGGGTWIDVNDHGATLALINWYSITARVGGKAVSRGEVVNSMSAAISPDVADAALHGLPLNRTNPFRLIGIYPANGEIVEWRWNLKQLVRQNHRWKSQQWISSGFDEPTAQRVRRKTFQRARRQYSAASMDWLRRLHRSHSPQAGPFSTCMHRADAATVSYTEVTVTSHEALMRYHASPPCERSTWSVHLLRLNHR